MDMSVYGRKNAWPLFVAALRVLSRGVVRLHFTDPKEADERQPA